MSRLKRVLRHVERALAIVGGLGLVYVAFFEVTCFTTGSMAPLLKGRENGGPDWALIEKWSAGSVPGRFQVVSFYTDAGVEVAKRVVGLPGETVAISSHTLLIDGKPVATPEGVGRGRGYLAAGNLHDPAKPFLVPPGKLYVLGDDSQDSEDSRFEGPIEVAAVRGRVVLRLWPLGRLKWLLSWRAA